MTNKRKCPNCQSTNHAEILWGLPSDMDKIEDKLRREEIVLGGCIVTENDPKWDVCNSLINNQIYNLLLCYGFIQKKPK